MVEKLAHDLRIAFPEPKGCSLRNLKYMGAFAEAWPDEEFVQQVVAQIPWSGHNVVRSTKLKDPALRLAYAEAAVESGWSRSVLVIRIKQKRIEREGQAVSNFEYTLLQVHSLLDGTFRPWR